MEILCGHTAAPISLLFSPLKLRYTGKKWADGGNPHLLFVSFSYAPCARLHAQDVLWSFRLVAMTDFVYQYLLGEATPQPEVAIKAQIRRSRFKLSRPVGDVLGEDCRFYQNADRDWAAMPLEQLAPDRPLMQTEWVVLDLETTGPGNDHHRIIEVGAVRVRAGLELERLSLLINPQQPIPPMITNLTGIREEMVAQAPTFAQAWPRIRRFLGTYPLVAHNAAFDFPFLQREARREGLEPLSNLCLCSLRLARLLLKGVPRKGLEGLALHFGVEMARHHRALDDALATAEIWGHLLALLPTDAPDNGPDPQTLHGLYHLLHHGLPQSARKKSALASPHLPQTPTEPLGQAFSQE